MSGPVTDAKRVPILQTRRKVLGLQLLQEEQKKKKDGRLSLPELLFIVIIGFFIGSMIIVVKSKEPFQCFVLGLIVIALFSLGGSGDFGFFFGAVLATIIGASFIPFIYWQIAGRKKKEIGVLRTAKIFFWCALVVSIIGGAVR